MQRVFSGVQRWLAQPSTPTNGAILFVIVGVLVIVFGFIYTQDYRDFRRLVEALYANVGVELFGIGITVLVIDRLNRTQAALERKRELILQLGSEDNDFALEAVRLLEQKQWLYDGTLAGARLVNANLTNANLYGAYLRGADLFGARLEGARLTFAHLEGARLRNATFDQTTILPDGTHWTPGIDLRKFTHPAEWRAEVDVP